MAVWCSARAVYNNRAVDTCSLPPTKRRDGRWLRCETLVAITWMLSSLLSSCDQPHAHPLSSGPRVVANQLVGPDGRRLVIGGAAQYSWPLFGSCSCYLETARGDYANRERIFKRFNELHINATRVFLDASTYKANPFHLPGGLQGELSWITDLVSSAARHGIYTLLTWNDSNEQGANWPSQYVRAFPMFSDVVQRLGPTNPWVLYEPWNEPNTVSWAEWESPVEATLKSFRGLGYMGPLLVDTIDWSWAFDPGEATRIMNSDKAVTGGAAQVVFANHRYANGQPCFTCGQRVVVGSSATDADRWETAVGRYATSYPIVGTEYGYYDSGAPEPGPDPTWNSELLTYLAQTKLQQGFNGYCDFIWDWNDENSMTNTPTDYVTLNRHGEIANSTFYSVYQTRAAGPFTRSSASPSS